MADDSEKKKPDYPVGYKKPPEHSRFKPGQSGNPKGKPKGSVNIRTAVRKELNKRVRITENGKERPVLMSEVIAKRIVNKAANADPKFVTTLLVLEGAAEEAAPGVSGPMTSDPVVAGVIENLFARIRNSRSLDPPADPLPAATPDEPPDSSGERATPEASPAEDES